jgi:hypothetical protein
MADEVIKNPARSAPHTPKRYEPEYVRLSKEPVEQNSGVASSVVASSVKRGSNSSFDSIDGIPFDEEGNEINIKHGHIIDNNDFVDFGPYNEPSVSKPVPESSNTSSPEIGDYILMVFGKLIASGPMTAIENRVKSIVYGEDAAFNGLDVSTDDIVVLKRIPIKVGVFIDD